MIRTLFVAVCLGLATLLVLPLLILWSWLTGDPDLMYFTAMRAVRACFRLAGVSARVSGLNNIPPGASVLAANHVSNLDPLLLLPEIPRRVLNGRRLPLCGWIITIHKSRDRPIRGNNRVHHREALASNSTLLFVTPVRLPPG